MNIRPYLPYLLLTGLTLIIFACAPEGPTTDEYGLFSGFWHGILFPFALIGKLFGMDVGLYAQNNSGFWYWAGFIIGICLYAGGGASRRKR